MARALARVVLILAIAMPASSAGGHPGGLAADGCHNDRKNGGRHCHGGGSTAQPQGFLGGQRASSGPFPNCAAARAAGAAPLRRGEPGYSTRLDRDGDGVACE